MKRKPAGATSSRFLAIPMFPDTLRLEYHLELCLNHLTRNLDPRMDHLPYFMTNFRCNPVEAVHAGADYPDLTGRYLDALILVRAALRGTAGATEEAALKKLLIRFFNEGDGLCYRQETDWCAHDAPMMHQSSVLFALVTWYMQEGGRQAEEYLERMIRALSDIAVWEGGIATYPYRVYPPGGWDADYDGGGTPFFGPAEAGYEAGRNILPLLRYYELSGSRRAWKLAEGTVRWALHDPSCFLRDGSFRGHYHCKLATLAGVLKYALMREDEALLRQCRDIYDFALSQNTRFGWAPEVVLVSGLSDEVCESCCLADVMDVGILLAEHGHPEYWNPIERMMRNQLIENQIDDVSRFPNGRSMDSTARASYENVPERIRGGFAGWCAPNDLVGERRLGPVKTQMWRLMHCCSPAGAHALYLLWQHAVRKCSDGAVEVNLLINHKTPWVTVKSDMPYQGCVHLDIKRGVRVRVRIPDWASRDENNLTVVCNGWATMPIPIQGDYILIDRCQEPCHVDVFFQLPRHRHQDTVGNTVYTTEWTGDTVTSISPKGRFFPLYEGRGGGELNLVHDPYRRAPHGIHWS